MAQDNTYSEVEDQHSAASRGMQTEPETAQENAPSAERNENSQTMSLYLQGCFVCTNGIQEAGRREAGKRRGHAFPHSPKAQKGCRARAVGSESEEATAQAGECTASRAQSSAGYG